MATFRNLPALVRDKFNAAQITGDLILYPTQVCLIKHQGISYQLRFSPSLAHKPKPRVSSNSKPSDPFENPAGGLFVACLLPFHNLVLNKFPVISGHFILSTKQYKEQTHLLEEDDFSAAYACITGYDDHGEGLFGFFNSGSHSGASQSHRHIQFLPVESMMAGIGSNEEWSVLIDHRPELPFTYFTSTVPKNPSPRQLHGIYLALYKEAVAAAQQSSCGYVLETSEVEARISYNLGFTQNTMALCPRLAEGNTIIGINGERIGPIALNGTILGGTLLVKNGEEWNALRDDESKIGSILKAIGIPSHVS